MSVRRDTCEGGCTSIGSDIYGWNSVLAFPFVLLTKERRGDRISLTRSLLCQSI